MQMARLTYFKGRGRAETTRWMLAATGVAFTNVAVETASELDELRRANVLPFDQMPLLEIDGRCLSQSSAMIRYLARRGGLYGADPTEAMWCDMIAGAAADFAETAIQAPFKPDAETAIADLQQRFAKFAPRFEARIVAQGSGFTAAATLTFADVVLCEALSSYLEWCPEILQHTPHLRGLYQTVTDMTGVAAYLASDLRYPKPGDDYVIAAARVLRRALPPHMPDPDRFVG